MISFLPHAQKAMEAVPKAEATLQRARRVLADHDANRPAGDDANLLFGWKRERVDHVLRVESAEEALEFSRKAAERARAEAEQKQRQAKHAALQREGPAAKKRLSALFAKIEALALELEWARDHVAMIERYNRTERGDLPPVADGEYLLRYQPGQEIPATYEEVDVWVDARGREPLEYVMHKGELVPADYRSYQKERQRRCVSDARTVPGRMPKRLADAIQLVNLAGDQIWPPQR